MEHSITMRENRIGVLLLPAMLVLVLVIAPLSVQEDLQEDSSSSPEEEPANPSFPSQTSDDLNTENALKNVYATVEVLQDVQVSVRRGVVTLTGTVPTPSDRKAAETIAEKFSHVPYVNNQVNVAKLQQSTRDPVTQQTLQDEEIQNTLTTIEEQDVLEE